MQASAAFFASPLSLRPTPRLTISGHGQLVRTPDVFEREVMVGLSSIRCPFGDSGYLGGHSLDLMLGLLGYAESALRIGMFCPGDWLRFDGQLVSVAWCPELPTLAVLIADPYDLNRLIVPGDDLLQQRPLRLVADDRIAA